MNLRSTSPNRQQNQRLASSSSNIGFKSQFSEDLASSPYRGLNVKDKWKMVVERIRTQMAHNGRRPMVPVGRIEELRHFFIDPKTGKDIELDLDMFCEAMSTALKGRNYTREELEAWFSDMDVDLSNGVSWEEFTSFLISAATAYGGENIRSKEFLVDNNIAPTTQNLHKDGIRRLVTTSKFVITGGNDGLVKLWDPQDGAHMFSINNNLYSAAHEAIPPGSSCPVSPIIDVCFNARSTHCYVAAGDKSVNIYDANTFALSRKFVGVMGASLEAAFWKPNNLGCDGIPDTLSAAQFRKTAGGSLFRSSDNVEASVLLNMMEGPSSMDIATPGDGEVLFFATHEGSIMAYPSLRTTVLAEIPQLAYYRNIHEKSISKMRYISDLKAVLTAGWDTSLCLTNAETGQCLHRLPGFSQQRLDYDATMLETMDIGHRKSVLDFSYSPATRLIASAGGDRNVLLWNPQFSLPVSSLRGHSAPLCAVSYDDVDSILLSMDSTGVVKTWDLRMNRCLQSFGGHGSGSSSNNNGTAKSSSSDAQSLNPSSLDSKLDVPTAMTYSNAFHRVFVGGRCIKSWTIRRAQTRFNPSHIGHCEGVLSFTAYPGSSSVITSDANVFMRWDVRNGKRLSLWDINPPTADGGDMLKQSGGSGGGSEGGSGGSGGSAASSSSVVCFERDSGQRRVLAATQDGALVTFNPTNGQLLRRMELGSYITDEPFRVAHMCNSFNSSKVIALITPNEAVFVSEDADEVTGLLPFGPYGVIKVPPVDPAWLTSPLGGGGDGGTAPVLPLFSAVSTYPAVGASTLSSLVLGTTEGQLLVYNPVSQELMVSVVHPKRTRTRQSSHRRHRRRVTPSLTSLSSPATSDGGGGIANNASMNATSYSTSSLVPASAPVEDIAYIRSLDLFATCLGDSALYFWDLRNGVLKWSFCTQMQPEECILSLATGEDNSPYVSYDTVLSRKPATLQSMLLKNHKTGTGGAIKSIDALLAEMLAAREAEKAGDVSHASGGGSSATGANTVEDYHTHLQQARSKKHKALIAGCDWGFVYVWDISQLPHASAAQHEFARTSIPLLAVFRAHNAPITRLSFFEEERLICTMSTVDCYVKTFQLKGNYVGHLGQRAPYWFRNQKSFASDSYSMAEEDEHPTPTQATMASMAAVTSRGGVSSSGGGKPPTRQLDSPLTNIFSSSSFFATAVRQPPSLRHAVESPAEVGGSTFAVIPVVATEDDDASGSVFPASPLLTSYGTKTRGGGAGGGKKNWNDIVAKGPPSSWVNPFSILTPEQRRQLATQSTHAPSGLHQHSVPGPAGAGGAAATAVTSGSVPNLRPVMFAKKRYSIGERAAMEEAHVARPRHLASIFEINKQRRQASPPDSGRGGDSSVASGGTPTSLQPIKSNKASTPGLVVEDGAISPTSTSSRRPPLARPVVLPTPNSSKKPPLSPLPSAGLFVTSPKHRSPLHSGGAALTPSFLLTDLEEEFLHGGQPPPGGENADDEQDAGDEAECNRNYYPGRSMSVPLLVRRLRDGGDDTAPIAILNRSSDRYRSHSSLAGSFAGGASPPTTSPLASPITLGEPRAGSDCRSDSPTGSALFLQSPKQTSHHLQLHRHDDVEALHKYSIERAAGGTNKRVDRVTRLIRDRELLRYEPCHVKSSLLADNDEMRRAVQIMPSAWTKRVASLMKTHELKLDEIKKLWTSVDVVSKPVPPRPTQRITVHVSENWMPGAQQQQASPSAQQQQNYYYD